MDHRVVDVFCYKLTGTNRTLTVRYLMGSMCTVGGAIGYRLVGERNSVSRRHCLLMFLKTITNFYGSIRYWKNDVSSNLKLTLNDLELRSNFVRKFRMNFFIVQHSVCFTDVSGHSLFCAMHQPLCRISCDSTCKTVEIGGFVLVIGYAITKYH